MVLLYVINDVRQYPRIFARAKGDRPFVGILAFQQAALASLCWRSWPLNVSHDRHLRFAVRRATHDDRLVSRKTTVRRRSMLG